MSLNEFTNTPTVIGVDLGGTKVKAARIQDSAVLEDYQINITAKGSQDDVLNEIRECISQIWTPEVEGIGIGVPSVVDLEKGIVYDVQNIPSWKEVHLGEFLTNHFDVPTVVNNDANCFALGEKYFGKARAYSNVVGVIMGTGMAGGIIINGTLHSGVNCAAGEFGCMPYRDSIYENYCSGQYFMREYGLKGEEVSARAADGDTEALAIYETFGKHVGNAMKSIFYALDPEIIILGGSVSKAFPYFGKSMRETINSNVFQNMAPTFRVELSENDLSYVLGAAALYYDKVKTTDMYLPD